MERALNRTAIARRVQESIGDAVEKALGDGWRERVRAVNWVDELTRAPIPEPLWVMRTAIASGDAIAISDDDRPLLEGPAGRAGEVAAAGLSQVGPVRGPR